MIQPPNIGPKWFWRIIFMIIAVAFLIFMYGLTQLFNTVLKQIFC